MATSGRIALWRVPRAPKQVVDAVKDAEFRYRPGEQSPAWLKVKPKLELDVLVTGGSAERIAWGDWVEAVMPGLAYKHPSSNKTIEIRQAVRIARRQPFELKTDRRASVVRWG